MPPNRSPPLVTPTFTGGRPSTNIFSNLPLRLILSATSVWASGAWKSMMPARRAEVGRRRGDDRVAPLERVQLVVALVVADEGHLRALRPSRQHHRARCCRRSCRCTAAARRSSGSASRCCRCCRCAPRRGRSAALGLVAVDGKTSVSASRNCAAASSCVPKVSCVFLPVVDVEAEQLLVAADPRHVDDGLPVGRPGRPGVGERVLGQVGDLPRREVDARRCRSCRPAAPRTPPSCRRARRRATPARPASACRSAASMSRVSTFCRISVRDFSARTK